MDVAATRPLQRIDLASERSLRIGRASIDPISREAAFGGRVERLQPQNLKVLILLARRRGAVVSRDELIQLCWDDRFVGEDVINRAISTLRRFAERAGGFEIETIPRVGYRLVETAPAGKGRPAMWVAAAAAMPFIVLAGGWYVQRDSARNAAADAPVIAVMAITEDSGDEEAHRLASATRASMANALSEGGYPVTLVDGRSGRKIGRASCRERV